MFRIKKKFLVVVFTIALSLIIVIPALAAYLGPNRSYNTLECTDECVEYRCFYEGTQAASPGYTCTIYVQIGSDPSACPGSAGLAQYTKARCGWPSGNDGADSQTFLGPTCNNQTQVCTNITNYHPEATVSGSRSCSTSGSNGWCLDSATVSISGSEPVSGQQITGIEGVDSINGNFYYGGSSTSWVESTPGSHSLTFWAFSNWGDTSRQGSLSVKVDTDVPTISGNISGSVGNNGWYVSNVTATASGGDNDSGVATQQVQVDGGGFVNNSSVISSDGNHSVLFKVTDNAGRTASTSSTDFKIDKTAPSVALTSHAVNIQTNGTLDLFGTASDATSGLVGIELSLDGGGSWISVGSGNTWSFSWDTTATADGSYAIELKATDNAGHVTHLSGWSILVDNTPPTLTYDVSGTQGSNHWYIGDAALTVSGTDATSGMDKAEIQIDGGGWVLNADTITTDGRYAVTFKTTDNVGNTTSETVMVNRDTVDPTFTLITPDILSGSGQFNFSGSANDATSGIASIQISLNDGKSWQTVTAATNWKYDWDTRSEVNGDYKLKFIVVDAAGHTIYPGTWIVTVDNNLPQVVMSGTCINSWQSLGFSVTKGNLEIRKTTISILGNTYENPSNPFNWDQRDPTGTYIDTPGDYTVTLTAYDTANNSTTATGCITIHPPLASGAVVESGSAENPDDNDSGDGDNSDEQPQSITTPVPLNITPSNLKQSSEITTTIIKKTGKEQVSTLVGPTLEPNSSSNSQPQGNAPLWGAAAAVAAAAATAYALSRLNARKKLEAAMEAAAKASQIRFAELRTAAEARYQQAKARAEASKLALWLSSQGNIRSSSITTRRRGRFISAGLGIALGFTSYLGVQRLNSNSNRLEQNTGPGTSWSRYSCFTQFECTYPIIKMYSSFMERGLPFEEVYAVDITGGWTESDVSRIQQDVRSANTFLTAMAISEGIAGDRVYGDVFNDVFALVNDKMKIELLETTGVGCAGARGQIVCNRGMGGVMDEFNQRGLTWHELAHPFDKETPGTWGYGRTAVKESTISTSTGEYVSGVDSDGDFVRTINGYEEDLLPFVQHPISRDEEGTTEYEDYADMFMNMIGNSFAPDDAGKARYEWIYDLTADMLKLYLVEEKP